MFGLNDSQNEEPVKTDDTPAGPSNGALDEPVPAIHDEPAPPAAELSNSDSDLITLKEQALKDLSPLVSHLDQTPDEKFKTLMMMIQASDDDSLVREAYEVAGQIKDDKARAQALLDIVNEINYFTQKDPKED